jgi:hypothetical protein
LPDRHGRHANGEAERSVTYPARHTHEAEPSGESEKAGHPRQLPANGPLYVSLGQGTQALAPASE